MTKAQKTLLSRRPNWKGLSQRITYEDKRKIFELIDYTPHEGQVPIHECSTRVRTVCCGRRFGKSFCAAAEAVVVALLGGGVWCVAPSSELSSIVSETALNFILSSDLRSQIACEPRTARGRQCVIFKSGGWILGKSSHQPRSLLGRGLDLVIFDEAALERNQEVWPQYLRPVLIDRIGSLMAISTPRGDDWFKELYEKGEMEQAGYASFRKASFDNPQIDRREIAELMEDYPAEFYKQEILAEFLDAIGALFRNYSKTMTVDELLDRPLGGSYVGGVDLAEHQDYTVISVMDCDTMDVVFMDRFNKVGWHEQEDRIAEIAERFNCPLVVDKTGIGDRVLLELQTKIDFVPVEGFLFNPVTKGNIMRQLAIAIEREQLHLPAKTVLTPEDSLNDRRLPLGKFIANELGSYRYDRSKSGTLNNGSLKMGAPAGKNDDIPTSLALMLEAGRRFAGLGYYGAAGTTHSTDPKGKDAEDDEERPGAIMTGTYGRKAAGSDRRRMSGGRRRSRISGL